MLLKLLYKGKTKDVYQIEEADKIDHVGKYVMLFKDTATGYIVDEGKPTKKIVFDSGYDTVVGEIPGKGIVDCHATTYFFNLLEQEHIPTHFITRLDSRRIIVEPATLFAKDNEALDLAGSASFNNLEIVFRHGYYGSLWRRHPHKQPCTALKTLIEIYAKGLPNEPDILMRDDTLTQLGIMTPQEIQDVKNLTNHVADLLSTEFAKKAMHLIDGKIEIGRRKTDGKIIVIDEISTSVFRACKGFTPNSHGDCATYRECMQTSYKDGKRTIKASNLLDPDQIAAILGFTHD
jgi:phosphoribosylaminoimidazole-succinocarboxamide synthase